MFHKAFLIVATGAAPLLCLSGCTENVSPKACPAPPPLATEPIGVQVTRAEARLKGLPFRVLLDFERPTDLAFLTPTSAAPVLSSDKAHTGQSALKLNPGAFDVKLASLLTGGTFPGNWTIAGAYFY